MKNYLYKLNRNYDNLREPRRFYTLSIPLIIVLLGDVLLNIWFQTPQGILLVLFIVIMSLPRAAYLFDWLSPNKS